MKRMGYNIIMRLSNKANKEKVTGVKIFYSANDSLSLGPQIKNTVTRRIENHTTASSSNGRIPFLKKDTLQI